MRPPLRPPPPPAAPPAPPVLDLMGRLAFLLAHSPLHRAYTIADVEQCFLPGVLLDQYRYYERAGQPLGFVCWAWLTDEASERYQREQPLDGVEWNRGPNLWYMEFVAPFGGVRHIVRDLGTNILPEHRGRALRRGPRGEVRKVVWYHGARARRVRAPGSSRRPSA